MPLALSNWEKPLMELRDGSSGVEGVLSSWNSPVVRFSRTTSVKVPLRQLPGRNHPETSSQLSLPSRRRAGWRLTGGASGGSGLRWFRQRPFFTLSGDGSGLPPLRGLTEVFLQECPDLVPAVHGLFLPVHGAVVIEETVAGAIVPVELVGFVMFL